MVDWFNKDEDDVDEELSLPKLELNEPLPELFKLALSAFVRLGVRLRLEALLLWQCFNICREIVLGSLHKHDIWRSH